MGESDRLVTVLTRDRGLVRAFAAGARNIKGKKQAATQLLSYGNFYFVKGKDAYRITETECVDVFFGLRNDLSKITLAQYLCELCGAVVPEQDEAGAYLRIMLNCLKFLETEKFPAEQLKAVAEFSLLTLAGYMPDTDGCHVCEESNEPFYFDPTNGVLLCEKHRSPYTIPLSVGVVRAIWHITHSTIDRLFSFQLSHGGLKQLATVSEAYVLAQLERNFTTLNFYHSLTDEIRN